MMYGEPLPPPPPHRRDNRPPSPRPGPGPEFLDAPGQPIGLVAGVVDEGTTVSAGVLDRRRCPHRGVANRHDAVGAWPPVERRPVTRNIDGLGRYRVVSEYSRRTGDTLVIGLSMSVVDATLLRVALIFAVVDRPPLLAVATAVGA